MNRRRKQQKVILDLLKEKERLEQLIAAKDIYQLYITQDNDRLQKNCEALMGTVTTQAKEYDLLRHAYDASENTRKKVTEALYAARKEIKSLNEELAYFHELCDSGAFLDKAEGGQK